MTDIVKVGESIEGLSVDGCSRDPLIDRGLTNHKNKRCYRYIAAFNVKSQIISELSKGIEKLEENAYCNLDVELICDKAIILSLNDRFASKIESNMSGTHGANLWHFTKQTNVSITRAHQEILNAIRKKEIKQQSNLT
ncbi:hypothetical protein KKA47_06980 [bacterium]|nr:hypothetical protein [bacterium]